jgi:nucleoside-diphosphate-sugar epimerase
MKVLVAGGSGYLGHWVCRLLHERGYDVLALSRRGDAEYGKGAVADVTVSGLGLPKEQLSDVDYIVSCFGSVVWDGLPASMVNLHLSGTRNMLDLAAELPAVRRVLHISSTLALGRAEGVVGNRELAVGQSFRNWYEYAKYRAEALARAERRVPVSVVRFGPLLGPAPEHLVPLTGGPLQVLSALLQGLPLLVERGGRFPIYLGDVAVAAAVVISLLETAEPVPVATYFDPRQPTLARVLHELCQPWGVIPRLVESSRGRWLQRIVADRLGVGSAPLAYTGPLVEFASDVLAALPQPVAAEREDYVTRTAELLRDSRRVLVAVEATS